MNYSLFTEMFPWVESMVQFFSSVFLILLFTVSIPVFESRIWSKQKKALEAWRFDDAYTREVLQKYPHLTENDVSEAFEQLRLYFQICWRYEKRLVAMPSRLVDTCWHLFILDTRNYEQFCELAFGRFLHHEPPSTVELQEMPADARNQWQMLANARAYQGAVRHGTHDRLIVPALFSIDERLCIDNGFCYSAEFLGNLATFDVKKAEASLSKSESAADGSGAACGDGGACGCGGSV